MSLPCLVNRTGWASQAEPPRSPDPIRFCGVPRCACAPARSHFEQRAKGWELEQAL